MAGLKLARVTKGPSGEVLTDWYVQSDRIAYMERASDTTTAVTLADGSLFFVRGSVETVAGFVWSVVRAHATPFTPLAAPAAPAASPSTAPSTPTVPYPVGVTAASWNARAVWDLRLPGQVGPATAPLKRVGVDALPAGVTQSPTRINFGPQCKGLVLDGWDFHGSGRGIGLDCDGITLRNCKLGGRVGYPVFVGANAKALAHLDRCDIDGTGTDDNFAGIVHVTNSSTVRITRSHIHNARNAAVVNTQGGRLEASWNLWGAPTLDGPAGVHGECWHPMSGSGLLQDNLFEMADGAGGRIKGFSGILFIEAYQTAITEVVVERNVFSGMRVQPGLYYAIGCSGPRFAVQRLLLKDNLIQAGAGRAYHYPNLAGLAVFSGNADLDTGALLPQPA